MEQVWTSNLLDFEFVGLRILQLDFMPSDAFTLWNSTWLLLWYLRSSVIIWFWVSSTPPSETWVGGKLGTLLLVSTAAASEGYLSRPYSARTVPFGGTSVVWARLVLCFRCENTLSVLLVSTRESLMPVNASAFHLECTENARWSITYCNPFWTRSEQHSWFGVLSDLSIQYHTVPISSALGVGCAFGLWPMKTGSLLPLTRLYSVWSHGPLLRCVRRLSAPCGRAAVSSFQQMWLDGSQRPWWGETGVEGKEPERHEFLGRVSYYTLLWIVCHATAQPSLPMLLKCGITWFSCFLLSSDAFRHCFFLRQLGDRIDNSILILFAGSPPLETWSWTRQGIAEGSSDVLNMEPLAMECFWTLSLSLLYIYIYNIWTAQGGGGSFQP